MQVLLSGDPDSRGGAKQAKNERVRKRHSRATGSMGPWFKTAASVDVSVSSRKLKHTEGMSFNPSGPPGPPGLEPGTFWSRARRATNCTTAQSRYVGTLIGQYEAGIVKYARPARAGACYMQSDVESADSAYVLETVGQVVFRVRGMLTCRSRCA